MTAAWPNASRVLGAHERPYFERRWRFFAGIWLVFLVEPLVTNWDHHSIIERVIAIVLTIEFSLGYVLLLPRGAFGGPSVFRFGGLAVMTTSTAIYFAVCGGGGVVFVPYLVVSSLLLLPWLWGIAIALVLGTAVTVVPQYVPTWDLHGMQWGIGAGTLFAAVVVAGMRAFAGTTNQLHRAEEEIEQMAAEQERLRIARDLHDLLGHALTTVTVKAELASRLVTLDPERAAAEMAEVAELGRQSLLDVRATVAGYREVSLVRELAMAREVLQAAGIDAELPAAAENVAGDLRELFGWAVREGITNAVRHSRAHHVVIRLEQRAIEVVNDGVDRALDGTGSNDPAAVGHGLVGLSERAAALGGEVRAGPDGPTGYRLRVEVPV